MTESKKTSTPLPSIYQPFLMLNKCTDDPDTPITPPSEKSIIKHLSIIYEATKKSLQKKKGLVTTCYFKFKTPNQRTAFEKTLHDMMLTLTPHYTINRLVYRNHTPTDLNLIILACTSRNELEEFTGFLEEKLTT
jgi:hypothetical protein